MAIEQGEVVTVETPAADPEVSLSEHEQEFPRTSRYAPPSAPPPATEPDADAQPRDDDGKFKAQRRRAKSQQARAEDVPRISELTRKLREVEAERDALKTATPKPVVQSTETQLRADNAAKESALRAAVIQSPSAPTTTALTKPNPSDAKYAAGPYDPQFQEDLAEWKYTALRAKERADDAEAAKKQKLTAETERIATSWKAKSDAATTKYPDFQKVALESPTRIPAGGIIDAYILEAKAGADVLYHLQHPEHAAELDALLVLSPFEQIEALTLLGQRLTTPQAVVTGSAAALSSPPSAPRPPNPVRTTPMRSGDEPPDPATGSLRDHESYFGRKNRR